MQRLMDYSICFEHIIKGTHKLGSRFPWSLSRDLVICFLDLNFIALSNPETSQTYLSLLVLS